MDKDIIRLYGFIYLFIVQVLLTLERTNVSQHVALKLVNAATCEGTPTRVRLHLDTMSLDHQSSHAFCGLRSAVSR